MKDIIEITIGIIIGAVIIMGVVVLISDMKDRR